MDVTGGVFLWELFFYQEVTLEWAYFAAGLQVCGEALRWRLTLSQTALTVESESAESRSTEDFDILGCGAIGVVVASLAKGRSNLSFALWVIASVMSWYVFRCRPLGSKEWPRWISGLRGRADHPRNLFP